jgi:hypothetical protein
MWQFLLARAKEPSSYAGFAMVLTALGIHYSDAEFSTVVNVLVALAGAIAVFVPEGKAGTSVNLLLVTALLGAVLTACSASSASSGLAEASAVATDVEAAVGAACNEEPAAEVAATPIAGSSVVKSLEAYANAVCANPSGPQVDASTAVWIGQIQGAIKSLATTAPSPAANQQ